MKIAILSLAAALAAAFNANAATSAYYSVTVGDQQYVHGVSIEDGTTGVAKSVTEIPCLETRRDDSTGAIESKIVHVDVGVVATLTNKGGGVTEYKIKSNQVDGWHLGSPVITGWEAAGSFTGDLFIGYAPDHFIAKTRKFLWFKYTHHTRVKGEQLIIRRTPPLTTS